MSSLCFVALLGSVLIGSSSSCSYMAVAPHMVEAGKQLQIPVEFMSPVTTQSVCATLYDDHSQHRLVSETLIGGTHVTLKMEVPEELKAGTYHLNISGRGSVNFQESTQVQVKSPAVYVFIQTDKTLYNPSQKIQYRVFAVDKTLKLPSVTLGSEIYNQDDQLIYSGKRMVNVDENLVDEFLVPIDTRGTWTIKAFVVGHGGSVRTETIQSVRVKVKDYVVPNSNSKIDLDLPFEGRLSDDTFPVTVKASDDEGQPIEGYIGVYISAWKQNTELDKGTMLPETLLVEGVANLDLMSQLRYITSSDPAGKTVTMVVSVYDKENNYYEPVTRTIEFPAATYKIDFLENMPENIKPGQQTYPLSIAVTDDEGKAIAEPKSDAMVTISYFTKTNAVTPPNQVAYPLRGDGTLDVDLELNDVNDVVGISIQVEYEGTKSEEKTVRLYHSPCNGYIQAKRLLEGDLSIGDEVTFHVSSNHFVSTANFMVLSYGMVISSGTVRVGENVKVKVTRDMIPTGQFVVYFTHTTGEVIADSVKFKIKDIFENKVEVHFGKRDSAAGLGTIIAVVADKQSRGFILATDERTLGSMPHNDITPQRVIDAISGMKKNSSMLGKACSWSLSSNDAADVFKNAQLQVFTDGTVYSHPNSHKDEHVGDSLAIAQTATATNGAKFKVSQEHMPRRNFPETWVFDSVLISSNYKAVEVTTPDSITTYVGNAYATNPITGLGVAKETVLLTVKKDFFMTIWYEHRTLFGEVVVLEANVTNRKSEAVDVVVTLPPSNKYFITDPGHSDQSQQLDKCVTVPAGGSKILYFLITPIMTGDVEISMHAVILKFFQFDEVVRTLHVTTRTVTQREIQPMTISQRNRIAGSQTNRVAGTKRQTYRMSLSNGNSNSMMNINYPRGAIDKKLKISVKPTRTPRRGDILYVNFRTKQGRIQSKAYSVQLDANNHPKEQFLEMDGNCNSLMINGNGFGAALITVTQIWYIPRRQVRSDVIRAPPKPLPMTGSKTNGMTGSKTNSVTGSQTNRVAGTKRQTYRMSLSNGNSNSMMSINYPRRAVDKKLKISVKPTRKPRRGDILYVNFRTKRGRIQSKAYSVQLDANNHPKEQFLEIDGNCNSLMINGNGFGAALITVTQIWYIPRRQKRSDVIGTAPQPLPMTISQTNGLTGSQTNGVTGSQTKPVRGSQSKRQTYKLSLSNGNSNSMMNINYPRGAIDKKLKISVKPTRRPRGGDILYVNFRTKQGRVQSKEQTIQVDSTNHPKEQFIEMDGNCNSLMINANGFGTALVTVTQYYNIRRRQRRMVEKLSPYLVWVDTKGATLDHYKANICIRSETKHNGFGDVAVDVGFVSGFEPVYAEIKKTNTTKSVEVIDKILRITFTEIPKEEVCVRVPAKRVAKVTSMQPAMVKIFALEHQYVYSTEEYLPEVLGTATLCDLCEECCQVQTSCIKT